MVPGKGVLAMKIEHGFAIGLALTSVGGATLALAPLLRPQLPDAPSAAWQMMNWAAIALLAAGLLMVLALAVVWLFGHLFRAVIQIEMRRSRCHYYISEAGVKDLAPLYDQYIDLFGRDLIPQEEFARWIEKNASIAYRVWRQNSRNLGESPEPIGFFDIEPLTSRGERRLRAERPNTLSITVDDIHSARLRPPHAYYVGSVGAPRGASDLVKGITLTFLVATIERLAEQRAITVYARPATDEGLYLIKLFQFTKLQKLPDKEAVWQRVLPAGARLTQDEQKFKRFTKVLRTLS